MIATLSPSRQPRVTHTLPAVAASTAAARRIVREALAAWLVESLADDGALLVTELVSNAVRHTGSRSLRVTVTRLDPTSVRISVVDKSPDLPIRVSANDDSVRGRGLALIEAITTRWGADPLRWGKRVWGELTVHTGR
ncbi:ATP-binding protein [Streptomyces profundus]|uniref:ATP-binding protein n=1 Tax=Streptomyces profundus TaxID=2867410 RepID=UPI001D16AE62|nr:ATP-binding protein [Streptomyces sp. MA3_2.13]UED85407.1 ATP-binding protein [Streptomyces sp. MA3_2.13]